MTRCPRCHTRLVRVAPQQHLGERLLGWLTIYPHRCQLCAHRFLAFCGDLLFIPQRNFHRVRVDFPSSIRSAFFQNHFPAVRGRMVNLSVGGCRLDGEVQIPEGARIRVEFEVGQDEKPVTVDEAVVRSHPGRGKELGLSFTKLRREEKRRIGRIVRAAMSSPIRRRGAMRERPAEPALDPRSWELADRRGR